METLEGQMAKMERMWRLVAAARGGGQGETTQGPG